MRHHFGVDLIARDPLPGGLPAFLLRQAGEHQFGIDVLVVGDEQAMVGTPVKRNETEKIVVVAELARLALR